MLVIRMVVRRSGHHRTVMRYITEEMFEPHVVSEIYLSFRGTKVFAMMPSAVRFFIIESTLIKEKYT